MVMGRGESKVGGGSLDALLTKARSAGANDILNSVPDNKMGKTFQGQNYMTKNAVKRMLALRRSDVEFLNKSPKYTQSQSFRATSDGKRYTVIIGTDSGRNIVYTLKQGNKFIVKNGSYVNVANQIALIIR